jgi:hypothetical protein
MNLESADHPKKAVYAVSKSTTSNYSLRAEIFLSPEGYGKNNLTDRSCCCTGDYAMERILTGAQQSPGYPHLVAILQEQNALGAASINEDSVELDILDDGANYERIPPRLRHKVLVVTTVEDDVGIRPLKVLRGGGRDCHDLPGCEFLLVP